MAKSTKRVSKKKADPFAEFEDWLKDGPAGVWPQRGQAGESLSKKQQIIVQNNVRLLLDREAWNEKVSRFEDNINRIDSGEEQQLKRKKFGVYFDHHNFNDVEKNFDGYRFPCSASFDYVDFGEGNVNFSGAYFGEGDVGFNYAKFGKGNVVFRAAKFGKGMVCFFKTDFGVGDVDFQYVVFESRIVFFGSAIFGGGLVSFHDTRFRGGSPCFNNVVFGKGEISFAHVTFGKGNVDFTQVKFGGGDIDFWGAEFGDGDFTFQPTKFLAKNINFEKTKFGKGVVYLKDIDMRSTAFLASDMEIEGSFSFNSTVVKSASFQRIKVGGTASFSESKFGEVPDFRDANFGRSPEVARMIVPPPSMKTKKKWWHFSRAENKEDVAKYRKLKAMALATNDHEKDGEFFAYEMMAKRGQETDSFGGLLFSSVYWGLSDFGQSFVKPVMWWLGSVYWFAFFYLMILNNGITNAPIGERLEAIWFALRHSFQNSVPIVGGFFRFTFRPDNSPDWYQGAYKILAEKNPNIELLNTLTVFQYAFGAVLLFFFGLALRNKFRLK